MQTDEQWCTGPGQCWYCWNGVVHPSIEEKEHLLAPLTEERGPDHSPNLHAVFINVFAFDPTEGDDLVDPCVQIFNHLPMAEAFIERMRAEGRPYAKHFYVAPIL